MLLLSRRAASALSLGTLFGLASCAGGGGESGSVPATQPISPQSAPATARSVLAMPNGSPLAWSPQTNGAFDYGTLHSGASPASQTFTLSNSGSPVKALTVTLTVTAPLPAPSPPGFAITADNCSGTTLGKNKSCTVTLTYSYTNTVAGESDAATLSATGGKGTMASVSLTGTSAAAPGSKTFGYTGGQQTFTVPLGIRVITVSAVGASGGNVTSNNAITESGGLGAEVNNASLGVTAGTTVYVYVGGRGVEGGYVLPFPGAPVGSGFNGGGNTTVASGGNSSGTGGGASDVRIGGTSLGNRQLIAAGGGGAGEFACGGAGGIPAGANGCGISGGTAGLGGGGMSGVGGDGQNFGGGGGGGYAGGGGGTNDAGGGGGSSFDVSGTGSMTQATFSGDGSVTITWR